MIRTRVLVTSAIVCGALGASIAGELHAQPAAPTPVAPRAPGVSAQRIAAPRLPAAAALRVQLPAALRARANATVPTKNGNITVQQALEKIDGTQTVTLSNGKTMTMQDLTDRLARSEASASAKSASLSSASVPEESWVKPTTPQKIQAQDVAAPQRAASLRKLARVPTECTNPPCPTTPIDDDGAGDWNPPANRPQPVVPGSCATSGRCRPRRGDVDLSWSRDSGDADFVAMDVAFGAHEKVDNHESVTCAASFNAGISLLGSRTSVVRYEAQENGRAPIGSSPAAGTGSASLYVGPRQVDLHFGARRTSSDTVSETFATAASTSIPIIPGISVRVGATAALQLGATLDGQRASEVATKGARCKEKLEPFAKITVTATGSVVIGIADLVELAEGGVVVSLVPLDVRIPTNEEAYVGTNPFLARMTFNSSLDTTYMKGNLKAFYRIADVCWDEWLDDGQTCFVRDILGIRTRGSKVLWSHGGYTERDTLAAVNKVLPWLEPAAVTSSTRPIGN